jgi:hypothetical protein
MPSIFDACSYASPSLFASLFICAPPPFPTLVPLHCTPPLQQNALAGFLVVKFPFGLTERFKTMTQQSVGAPALDTSYVSSGSMYLLAQQGINRVLELTRSE